MDNNTDREMVRHEGTDDIHKLIQALDEVHRRQIQVVNVVHFM